MRGHASILAALLTLALIGTLAASPSRPPPGPTPTLERLPMNLSGLESVIRSMGSEIKGRPGYWEFVRKGSTMACIADAGADRMRLIAPIVAVDDMTDAQTATVLEANFHTSIDARYATSNGILYSAFLHPLSSLTVDDLRSAIDQTSSLARNFGGSYSSDVLIFGGGGKSEPEPTVH